MLPLQIPTHRLGLAAERKVQYLFPKAGIGAMSDELDWNFVNTDDAKVEIRAAVEYLLRDATGTGRAEIVLEIIEIVRQVANGLPPGPPDPLDDLAGG
jgi:hypothetical protein